MVCTLVMVRWVWKPFLRSFLWDFCSLFITLHLHLLQIGVGALFQNFSLYINGLEGGGFFFAGLVFCIILFFFLLGGYVMITDITSFFGAAIVVFGFMSSGHLCNTIFEDSWGSMILILDFSYPRNSVSVVFCVHIGGLVVSMAPSGLK